MYSQIQVPIPVHQSTPQCAIITCHLTKKYFNWWIDIHFNSRYKTPTTELVLIHITNFVDSNTTKKCWQWFDTNTNASTQCSPTKFHCVFYWPKHLSKDGHTPMRPVTEENQYLCGLLCIKPEKLSTKDELSCVYTYT